MTITGKVIIGLIICAVLAGTGYYLYTQKANDVVSATQTENTSSETQQQPSTGKKMAFAEFAKQGGSYQCTVHQSTNGTDVTGTVYMDKGMVRGDYGADYAGQHVNIMFVARDGFTYVWNTMMPTTGFKIKNNTTAQVGNTQAGTSGTITASLDQIGDYNCTPWTTDASKFTIPTTVTFQTMGQ